MADNGNSEYILFDDTSIQTPEWVMTAVDLVISDDATAAFDADKDWIITGGPTSWDDVNNVTITTAVASVVDANATSTTECTDLPYQITQTYITKEANMFTPLNTLGIILICIVVYKLMPKITLLNLFRWFVRLVKKPFNKAKEDAKKAWENAKLKENDYS